MRMLSTVVVWILMVMVSFFQMSHEASEIDGSKWLLTSKLDWEFEIVERNCRYTTDCYMDDFCSAPGNKLMQNEYCHRFKLEDDDVKLRCDSFAYQTSPTGSTMVVILIICLVFSTAFIEQQRLPAKQYENPAPKDDDELSFLRLPNLYRPYICDTITYTVPQYGENHNPMLPMNLQQKLDAMSPRDFLSYVLTELSLEERESLMIDERQRRKTFQVSWAHDSNLSGTRMAQAGFYALGDNDRVQCVFCRGSLHQWESDDNPMSEHGRSFNFCRFVKGLECGNIEYRSTMLTSDDIKNITTYAPEIQISNRDGVADSGSLGISTNRAATVQYAPAGTRLRTFSRWPASAPIAAQRMCDAGFYYTGFDDQVCCFYCSGGIKGWVATDKPWEEHARWFPDCAFLIQQKGQQFVDEVHTRTPAEKKRARQTKAQQKDEIKQIKTKTEQQYMKAACMDFGHSPEIIKQAIEINGGPFVSIGKMIDMIHAIEDDEAPSPPTSLMATDSIQTCPEEDEVQARHQLAEPSITPGIVGNARQTQKFKLGCWNCERRTDSFVPATHIALPCGHLIYCSACNIEESRRARNPEHKAVCPTYGCKTGVTATMKIYFA